MKVSVIRKKAIIINNIKRFFYKNRFCFILLFLVFVIGLITGIFVSFKKCDYLSSDILNKFIIFRFLSKDIGLVLFIIRKLFFVLLIGALCFLLSKFKISIILFNILIFFLSYYLGLLVSTLIVLYGFVGIINVLLAILPFELLLYSVLIFYIVLLCYHRCCFCSTGYQLNEILKKLFLFFLIAFFVILVEGIIIKLLTNSIIFVI